MTSRVMYAIVRESPLATRIPFVDIGDLSVMLIENAGLPTPGYRPINPSSISEKKVPFNQRAETLKILSDKLLVDRQLLDNKSAYVNPLSESVAGYSRAVAYQIVDSFVNGDPAVNVDEPAGLVYRFKTDLRLSDGSVAPATQKQVIDANLDGADFTTTANANALIDSMHTALDLVDGGSADVILVNRQTKQNIRKAALGQKWFDTSRDQFERTVMSFNGIPILDAGVKPAGVADRATAQQIIPTGTANDLVTDAMYFIRFGQTDVHGIQKKALEVNKFEPDQSSWPNHTVIFEWAYGFHISSPFSVVAVRRAS
jgi:hypothetical protein